jgi:ABC-type amino acid transport substrate-binding protein
MKSLNNKGYLNEPSYSIYKLQKSNNNKTLLDLKLFQAFGSRYHKTYFDHLKATKKNPDENKTLKIESSFENIDNNLDLNLTHQDFYIVVAYDEQPYIFIENLITDDDTLCSLGMICYETDSIERYPREFFDILNKNEHFVVVELNKHNFKKRCCYGISISILNIMNTKIEETGQEKMKFYLYVLKQRSNRQLSNLADETVYDLYTNQADFSIAPLSVSRRREKYIDFAHEFYHDNYVLIGRRNFANTSLIAFLSPFEWSMWLGVLFTLNIAALIETLYEWLSPYGLTPRGRDRTQIWSLASALTLCWSVLFSHTFKTKSPKCWSTRFLGNLWGSFAVIFIASYTANLAAVMVGTKRMYQITGIKDSILSANIYKIGILANSSAEMFFQTSRPYRHLYSNIHKNRYESVPVAVKALTENKIDFLIMEHSLATYYVLKSVNRSLEMIGEPFGKLAFSFAFPKESSIYNLISNKILSMQNDGTIEKSLKDWFMDWKCEKDQSFQVLLSFIKMKI